ncbi:Peptidoglycan D,D-transpeptidase MrdA [hydrothermal vent metagenome]|uniref:Peptidoglycan D,D-transpeptidase MrdA n=1 Tax=hydrothermal vent metagenome TaxID=652676 RepID=A0A3B0VC17_9ZZZZ
MKNIRKRRKKREDQARRPVLNRDAEMTLISPHDDAELDFFKKRALSSAVVLIFFFAVLVSRLWYLQIQQGDKYRQLADSNRVRYVEVVPPRGNIFDRKGRAIVTNRPSFNVVMSRENRGINDELLKKMASILGEDVSVLLERIRKMAGTPGHIPIRLAEDIDWDKVAFIENNRLELPGIRIEVVPRRIYHYGNLASHVIGYLGEINERELKASAAGVYRGGDLVGKMGLERLLEKDLRGEKGREYMEVNSLGFEQKYLKGIEPLPGDDLKLTINMDLQRVAEDTMAAQDKAGAVVAVEVNSGRLLVAASSPALKLDEFVGGISYKAWQAMLDNSRHPLVNKVVQGQYPPGSTYKLVTALAGLASGVITPDTVFYCPGYYRLGNRTFHCWKHAGHGAVNLIQALAQSCDVYFYHVGQLLGVDRLALYAEKLGFGRKTGVEMQGEKSGLVPTAAWKMRRYNRPWQEGETLTVAIGQGFDLVTPLQLCMMTATIANGGTLYKPGLVESIRDPSGRLVKQFEPHISGRLTGQSANLKIIREGMIEAVNSRHGTGRAARLKGITVAGKTGTAQVVRLRQFKHMREEDVPYKYRDHAWFTCFAPAENPEIAVTVLVEHGMHGGSAAAPVARAVLQAYFKDRLKKTGNPALVMSPGRGGRSRAD